MTVLMTAQGPVDVPEMVAEMLRLPTFRSAWRTNWPGRRRGANWLTVRRRSDQSYSGHAVSGRSVVISFGEGQDREVLEMICLHELAHLVLPTSEHHGDLFKRTYRKAAREWWPGLRLDETPSRVYQHADEPGSGLDGLIINRGREARIAAEAAQKEVA